MTALDRLLAESVPDGTFGGAREPGWAAPLPPAPRRGKTGPRPGRVREPIPEWQAALNRRVLEAALDEHGADRARRHLSVVPPPATAYPPAA